MLTRKISTTTQLINAKSDSSTPQTEDFTVAILLCSYNGEKFLDRQIESIQRQTHKNWTLYISDDGSSDSTLSVIRALQGAVPAGKIHLFKGPRRGFASNFISLLTRAEVQADFYAFCDQDDIWHEDKLERSLKCLASAPSHLPALYCARTRLIDEQGAIIGYSPLFSRPPGFSNALVQSIAGANTMLINHQARALLNIDFEAAPIVAHDWLIYLIVAGAEGFIYYDPLPALDYRQHPGNIIGDQSGFHLKLTRFRKAFSGRFKVWCDHNIKILGRVRHVLTKQNQVKLDDFSSARSSGLLRRMHLMRRARIYRQTATGNIGLFFAVVLNKL
ncbi:glycosyltransferase family 2 protein [Pseudomonas sp. Pseu.R1]|uniref:glycosyltransferase family 2 protein n=1 Tax=Pseudomonas sp. Pseu.R1 TaxID=3379818 RepID=UPI003B92BDCA